MTTSNKLTWKSNAAIRNEYIISRLKTKNYASKLERFVFGNHKIYIGFEVKQFQHPFSHQLFPQTASLEPCSENHHQQVMQFPSAFLFVTSLLNGNRCSSNDTDPHDYAALGQTPTAWRMIQYQTLPSRWHSRAFPTTAVRLATCLCFSIRRGVPSLRRVAPCASSDSNLNARATQSNGRSAAEHLCSAVVVCSWRHEWNVRVEISSVQCMISVKIVTCDQLTSLRCICKSGKNKAEQWIPLI